MTDPTAGKTPGRQRIKTLTQAALNADMTVGQVEALLVDLESTVVDLNQSIGGLNITMERFNDTITRIDELAPRLFGVVERMERIVERVEVMVGVGETVLAPVAATENAVRRVLLAVRRSAGI